MTDGQIETACYLVAALCALGLLLLANPRSFLSRLVDRPDETPTREVHQS